MDVDLLPRRDGFVIEARVRTDARTGAEMEALHAVAVAALTVYDMVKAADKAMTIGEIRLVRKTGGRSGEYRGARSSAQAEGPPRDDVRRRVEPARRRMSRRRSAGLRRALELEQAACSSRKTSF